MTDGTGPSHSYTTILNPALSTTYQKYEFLFTATSANFELSTSSSATSYSAEAPDAGDTFTFDNIVIKEVSDDQIATKTDFNKGHYYYVFDDPVNKVYIYKNKVRIPKK